MAREFYTDIRDTSEDSEHFTTYVQGVLFEFSTYLIATTLCLSRVACDPYHFWPKSAIPTLSSVASVLYGLPYPYGWNFQLWYHKDLVRDQVWR